MDYYVDQLPVSEEWKPTVKKLAMSAITWGDWFIGLRDPYDILRLHSSYLGNEIFFYICGLITFIHAWRHGGRYMYLWIATIIHGLNTELIAYFVPDVDNFWHAQTSVMLFGRRAPLHILFLYPIFDYTATIAAKRMRLNSVLATACATGLFAVLIDIPYDIMGVKLLWWSWHDTDPNIYDRMYHVPWTSYYFHAAFACSFTLVLNGMRKLILPEEYDWKLFPREFLCAFVAGVSAFWIGSMQFIPVYHLLHDGFKVHTEICAFLFLGTYVLIVWTADRRPKKLTKEAFWFFDELYLMLVIHYLFYMVLVVFADPVNITSVGLHEPIGPCNEVKPVQTLSGMVLSKKAYLCPTKYHEPYFDFHCAPTAKPPKPEGGRPIEWYPICGTEFHNHVEYIAIIWALCLTGLYVFYRCFATSPTPQVPRKRYKPKKD